MLFQKEPGIIYDTLSYNMLYFNQPLIVNQDKLLFPNDDNLLLYFDLFHNGRRRLDPSPRLRPFFIFHSRYLAAYPLFSYFWNNYDFSECNTEDFLNSLRSEKFMRTCLMFYLKDHLTEVNIDKLIAGDQRESVRAITLLHSRGYDITFFVDFFTAFNDLVEELISHFEECRREMISFHDQYWANFESSIYNTIENSAPVLRRMHDIPENIDLKEQNITFHMMDHLYLLSKRVDTSNPRTTHILFMSASCERAISRWSDTASINILSFGHDFGNDVNYRIIQALRTQDMTASQLSQELFVSRSTISRALSSLEENQVVRASRKIHKEIFYSLNAMYFMTARMKIVRDIDNILADILYCGVKSKNGMPINKHRAYIYMQAQRFIDWGASVDFAKYNFS